MKNTTADPQDTPSQKLNAAAVLFPVIGLVLYLLLQRKAPAKACSILDFALFSINAGIIFSALESFFLNNFIQSLGLFVIRYILLGPLLNIFFYIT